MRPLSEKIAGVVESATIAISNRAKTMQREGIDVISLSIGEPDFATPQAYYGCLHRCPETVARLTTPRATASPS